MPILHSPTISIATFISPHRIALLILTILLTACAMSPQTVYIKPELKVPTMPIGHGRPLAVETRDLRHDSTLGTLGGVYKTAALTTDTRIEQSITQEAITVLQGWDFVAAPTSLSQPTTDRLTITLKNIEYQHPAVSVGGNVVVKCRVAVRIERSGEIYNGEYLSQRSEQVALMGTVQGNRRLINETVSQALNQIFLDSKLQRFLSR